MFTRRSKSSGRGGNTVIGQVVIRKGTLVVETNSVERVEAVCGGLSHYPALPGPCFEIARQ